MTSRVVLAMTAAALVVAALALNSIYAVGQGRQALQLRFGRPVAIVNGLASDEPGLKAKLPFVDTIIEFDKRDQSLETPEQDVATSDQNHLRVDTVMTFRILDPLRFYRALGDDHAAAAGLARILHSSVQEVLVSTSSRDIIGGDRDRLMSQVRDTAIREARTSGLGIAIDQVMIRRIDLPKASLAGVIRRMQAARQAQAARIRAEGEQHKREIIAAADKEVAVIRGTAAGQSEQIRGDGEARRDAILAQAYGRDPQFARFYRTMQAYQSALGAGDTTMVLSPDSEFLRDFTKTPGADK